MPAGRRESYEAVPRRPEQQGTEGPALSMSPVFSVPLLPCLKQTLSCLSPLLLIEPVHLLPCLSHTLSPYPPYPAPASALCYSQNLFICYLVSYYKQLVYPSTRPPVNLPRYPVFLIPCPYLKHTLYLSQPSVTPRTCSSVTLSFSYPTPVSNIPCLCISPLLLPELVHLLPCLSHTLSLSQTYPAPVSALCYSSNLFICYPVFLIPYSCLKHTLSPYPPYPVPLSTLPCPYPVTKKVKPYSFTFFFFPLLSLLIRSRAVTTKTYFVCPP